MPRAHRHYLAGQIWHLTHRCHQRQFLLKFARDRQAWIGWLFEARKRFSLCVLDYMVTSNHIHLLVHDLKGHEVIPRSIQLTAGRSGQQYNQRKEKEDAAHFGKTDTMPPRSKAARISDNAWSILI